MNFLDRADEAFLDKAFDPQQRKKAIDDMAFTRPVIFGTWLIAFGLAVLIPLLVLTLPLFHSSIDTENALLPFIVAVPGILALTISYLRFEERLRLLKIIDRLQREQAASPEPKGVEAGPIHELVGS